MIKSIGIAGLIWCVAWFFLAANTPDQHKFISEVEKNYILNNIQETNRKDLVRKRIIFFFNIFIYFCSYV